MINKFENKENMTSFSHENRMYDYILYAVVSAFISMF